MQVPYPLSNMIQFDLDLDQIHAHINPDGQQAPTNLDPYHLRLHRQQYAGDSPEERFEDAQVHDDEQESHVDSLGKVHLQEEYHSQVSAED